MPTLQQAWLCEQSVGDDQRSGLILQLNSCQQWHRRILQSTWAGTSSNTLILIMAFTALPATVSESLTCRLLPRHSSHQDNLSSLCGYMQSRWKVKKKFRSRSDSLPVLGSFWATVWFPSLSSRGWPCEAICCRYLHPPQLPGHFYLTGGDNANGIESWRLMNLSHSSKNGWRVFNTWN